MRRTVSFVFMAAVLLASLVGHAPGVLVSASQATPVATAVATPGPGSVEVVAHGLTNPRGITWGADGTLFVALSGVGGDHAGTIKAPVVQVVGTLYGGKTASVVKIEGACPVTIAPNLPSTRDEGGVTVGAAAVTILGDQMYVLIGGGGIVHGNPDTPNGVYRIDADGSATLVADISAFIRANPVAKSGGEQDYSPEGDPFGMVADPATGVLWVTESNSGQLLKVELDGTITRVADFSIDNSVPTAITLAPDGGVYVGFLTSVPFVDGFSKVVKVTPDGTVTDVWTGLTMLSAISIGPDGSLYALEMSTGNKPKPPFMNFESGKVLKQTGPDSSVEIATGLPLPTEMQFGPDGLLYLVYPGIAAAAGEGTIVRFAPDADHVTTLSDLGATPAACAGAATPVSASTPVQPPFTPSKSSTPAATPAG